MVPNRGERPAFSDFRLPVVLLTFLSSIPVSFVGLIALRGPIVVVEPSDNVLFGGAGEELNGKILLSLSGVIYEVVVDSVGKNFVLLKDAWSGSLFEMDLASGGGSDPGGAGDRLLQA